jgi:hypothetical protein
MVGRIVVGFVAAVLAVLVFHQTGGMAAKALGLLPATWAPYNMTEFKGALPAATSVFTSLGFAGMPTLVNTMFWGGVWGIVFGLTHGLFPGGSMIVKGLVLGVIIALFNWTLLPFIQGSLRGIPNQVYFAGGVPMRMLTTLFFALPFGFGTGLFYGLLRRNA